MELNRHDCEMILESLEYTRQAFENYPVAAEYNQHRGYPSLEFKRNRMKELSSVITKIRAIKANGALPIEEN